MMRLVYPWIRIQAAIDHDPVDEVINDSGDAVDTAESVPVILRLRTQWPRLM